LKKNFGANGPLEDQKTGGEGELLFWGGGDISKKGGFLKKITIF